MGDRMIAACVVSVGTDTDTVSRAIASSLAAAGFSVTWLVVGDAPGPESRLPIAVERLDVAQAPESVRPAVRRAYSVWQRCRARAFDLICYPDRRRCPWGGRACWDPQGPGSPFGATVRQPSHWITSEGWLTAVDDFRNWLVREAA